MIVPSRLFRSYTALRVWAILGMGWTALAAIVAVFVASAALWSHLTRVEYVPAPPARAAFPSSADLGEWVKTAAPPGFEVRQMGSGGGGGGGADRDGTPPGAWRTVRLRTSEEHSHVDGYLRGPADRGGLREFYGGPFRDAVRERLAAWASDATVTPLNDPDPPSKAGLPAGADFDAWGVAYTAERAGGVYEGTMIWSLAPSRHRINRPQPGEVGYNLTVEVSEERWTRR